MKLKLLAALLAACLLLPACGGESPSFIPEAGAEHGSGVPGADEEVAAPGEEPAESMWHLHEMRLVASSSYHNLICEVPGGFVNLVQEIAPGLDAQGEAYARWQLYFTDVSTRVCEKIEGAVIDFTEYDRDMELFERETIASLFYAGGRVYLLLKHTLFSLALDGSDVKLEYSMPYEKRIGRGEEYQYWGDRFCTDGESLYFMRKTALKGSTDEDGQWYYAVCPDELVRLYLPTMEEEILYEAPGQMTLYSAQGFELFVGEFRHEEDMARFFDEERRLADPAGYFLAAENGYGQLTEVNTKTGAARGVWAFEDFNFTGLLHNTSRTNPPLMTGLLVGDDRQGIQYYDPLQGWTYIPGTEEESRMHVWYWDPDNGRVVIAQQVSWSEETGDVFSYFTSALSKEAELREWATVGQAPESLPNMVMMPRGSVGEYYVIETTHDTMVGYVWGDELVVAPTSNNQPGNELGASQRYVVVTRPVYQLILKEDFWAGNANFLPITVV